MPNRYAFECLDRSLRDIMKSVNPRRAQLPFGGITVVLGRDFRQILPVIARGSRSDIVNACITRSRLWERCKVFKLKTNMRLNKGTTQKQKDIIEEFGKWVLDIGNGSWDLQMCSYNSDITNEELIEIHVQYCLQSNVTPIDDIIQSTFPGLADNYEDLQYISQRAILNPTNETVSHINKLILQKIPGDLFSYFSTDTGEEIGVSDHDLRSSFHVEYLNSLALPGILHHELQLKVGVVVMLMRNLNQTLGLCNGTRLIVRRCMKNAIECEVIVGNFVGSRHFIPRMELGPTECRLHVLLIRRQFPLQLCYAMTINKAKGQSLEKVGIYLPKPVFTHGQFYVAVSRATSPEGLKVLIDSESDGTTNITRNVVFQEVFYNTP